MEFASAALKRRATGVSVVRRALTPGASPDQLEPCGTQQKLYYIVRDCPVSGSFIPIQPDACRRPEGPRVRSDCRGGSPLCADPARGCATGVTGASDGAA